MKVLNQTTKNPSFNGDFGWNHIGVQDGKRPLKLKRLEIQ